MIHNKQYYIDKYVKRVTELNEKYKNDFDQSSEEFDQVCTPEEIAGYYLVNEGDRAFAVWLDNLSNAYPNCEWQTEKDREVTTIFKDLQDLEVINNYIMEVVDGNGINSDRLMNIHEYINERRIDNFNTSDVLLTNMSNELLSSMSEVIGEDLDSIFLTYDYNTDKVSAYLSNDFTVDDYPIELNKDTVEKIMELFEDAIVFRQDYEIRGLVISDYYHEALKHDGDVDDWDCAYLWITEDFGVTYNLCYEGKECYSAIYVMRYDEEMEDFIVDHDNYMHYDINCTENDWIEKLKYAMYKFAVEEYKAEHKEAKGDDNVNETKKETTTETKGNTVYVTIYDAPEDPMLSSAGIRATTEISFDNVRGITYEGEYCVIWYNDTKISFRIKEIAMITFSNK